MLCIARCCIRTCGVAPSRARCNVVPTSHASSTHRTFQQLRPSWCLRRAMRHDPCIMTCGAHRPSRAGTPTAEPEQAGGKHSFVPGVFQVIIELAYGARLEACSARGDAPIPLTTVSPQTWSGCTSRTTGRKRAAHRSHSAGSGIDSDSGGGPTCSPPHTCTVRSPKPRPRKL